MTDLLIFIMHETKTHTVPEERRENGRWRKGEPVSVKLDPGGRRITNGSPAFDHVYVSDFPGTLSDAQEFFTQEHEKVIGVEPEDGSPIMELVARRKNVLDQFTDAQKTALGRDGFISITHAELTAATRTRPPRRRDDG